MKGQTTPRHLAEEERRLWGRILLLLPEREAWGSGGPGDRSIWVWWKLPGLDS